MLIGSMDFADVGDRVGNRGRAKYFDDVVFLFTPDSHAQLGQKLAAVVHELDVNERDGALDGIVLSDIRELFLRAAAVFVRRGTRWTFFPTISGQFFSDCSSRKENFATRSSVERLKRLREPIASTARMNTVAMMTPSGLSMMLSISVNAKTGGDYPEICGPQPLRSCHSASATASAPENIKTRTPVA